MNGSVSWPADVYVKPEVETPPESSARPDVVMPTDRPTPIAVRGSDLYKNLGEHNLTTYDEKTDDVRSRSNTQTSPKVDDGEAAIERRLQAAAAGAGYKYKDNIKRRFCSESDAQTPSNVDTRSYSSLSDGASSAPDYSPPSSPVALPHNATVGDERATMPTYSCRRTAPTADGQPQRSPGFVLHPSGAYYVPVIVATAQLHAFLTASMPTSSLPGQHVCHPVSIPVRYTGSDGATTADIVSVNDVASPEQRPLQCQSLHSVSRYTKSHFV